MKTMSNLSFQSPMDYNFFFNNKNMMQESFLNEEIYDNKHHSKFRKYQSLVLLFFTKLQFSMQFFHPKTSSGKKFRLH